MTWWRTSQRRWAALAAIVGFALVAIYLTVMISEGNNDTIEVAPWTFGMLLPAVLSLTAWNTDTDRKARVLLLTSAALFLAIGVVSIFSLGVGFLAAGAMALFAANELPRSDRN
jgi:cytochrome bd-type quinol oxidase subunit 2